MLRRDTGTSSKFFDKNNQKLKKSSDTFNCSQNQLPYATSFIGSNELSSAYESNLQRKSHIYQTFDSETESSNVPRLNVFKSRPSLNFRDFRSQEKKQGMYLGINDLKKEIKNNEQKFVGQYNKTPKKFKNFRNTASLESKYYDTLEKQNTMAANTQYDDFVTHCYL